MDRHDSHFPELLTTAQVAAILCVPLSTVQHWACHGDGPPSFKVGRHRRFIADDVRLWLLAQQGGAA